MGQNTLCHNRLDRCWPAREFIETWLTPPGLRGASEGTWCGRGATISKVEETVFRPFIWQNAIWSSLTCCKFRRHHVLIFWKWRPATCGQYNIICRWWCCKFRRHVLLFCYWRHATCSNRIWWWEQNVLRRWHRHLLCCMMMICFKQLRNIFIFRLIWWLLKSLLFLWFQLFFVF